LNLDIGDSGPVILLAGAGLSVWHPTSLALWSEFNQVLLEEAQLRAARALQPKSTLAAAVRSLELKQIGSKARTPRFRVRIRFAQAGLRDGAGARRLSPPAAC
jgi:hypothetical protein